MKCNVCQDDKLSKEFPHENILRDCHHPINYCLRCVINQLSSSILSCPCKDCPNSVERASSNELLKFYQNEMDQLYPPVESSGMEDIEQIDISSVDKRINVTTLTGDSATFPFHPPITIENFKLEIQKKFNVTPDKQQLMYGDVVLESYRNGKEATIQDYNLKPFTTVHLMVLLYAIPQNFNHVIFDLFWGYPARGTDYLDASCLIFSGKAHINTVDYSKRNISNNAVWHSGDVMGPTQGHHTIEVRLKDIPSNITHLYFTLSAWNSPTIAHFPNPSLKFFEASDKQKNLCETTFTHARNSQAVIMCSLTRSAAGQWKIFNSGKLSAGNARNYSLLIQTIQSLP